MPPIVNHRTRADGRSGRGTGKVAFDAYKRGRDDSVHLRGNGGWGSGRSQCACNSRIDIALRQSLRWWFHSIVQEHQRERDGNTEQNKHHTARARVKLCDARAPSRNARRWFFLGRWRRFFKLAVRIYGHATPHFLAVTFMHTHRTRKKVSWRDGWRNESQACITRHVWWITAYVWRLAYVIIVRTLVIRVNRLCNFLSFSYTH